jgi:hypothetical protein
MKPHPVHTLTPARAQAASASVSDRQTHVQAEFKDLKEQYSGRIHLKKGAARYPRGPPSHHAHLPRSPPPPAATHFFDVSSSRSAASP